MLGDGDILVTEGEERYSRSGRYSSRFVQLFTIARIRRATLAAFVVMIAQQMCGSRPLSPPPLNDSLNNTYSQHHGILFLYPFCGCPCYREKRFACVLGLRPHQLCVGNNAGRTPYVTALIISIGLLGLLCDLSITLDVETYFFSRFHIWLGHFLLRDFASIFRIAAELT